MSVKNFLLYFGNARAGSTWLHGELSRRPDCNFPLQKEIYIFQDFNPVSGPEGFDKSKYFENMAKLVDDNEILLTGDITPSNANATKEQLYWFKKNADNYGLTVLPVMTLRDPISQVVSYTMMSMSTGKFIEDNSMNNYDILKVKSWYIKQVLTNTPGITPNSVNDILEFGRPAFEESLTSWEQTVENVTEVFGNLHINLYENMFNRESITSLFSYLGISYDNLTTTQQGKQQEFSFLSETEILELLELYPFNKETYDYAVSRFGKDLADSIWLSTDEIDFSRKIFSFGKHPEFSDDDKLLLYDNYPFMRENYDFAVKRFGKDLIESVWWNPYK